MLQSLKSRTPVPAVWTLRAAAYLDNVEEDAVSQKYNYRMDL